MSVETTRDVEDELDRRTPNTHRAQLRKSMERVRANEDGGEAFWQELDSWSAYLDQQDAEIRRLRSDLEELRDRDSADPRHVEAWRKMYERAITAEAELERRDAALRILTEAVELLQSVAWVDSETCRWCGTGQPVEHADLCPLAIIGNKVAAGLATGGDDE